LSQLFNYIRSRSLRPILPAMLCSFDRCTFGFDERLLCRRCAIPFTAAAWPV